MTPLMLHVSHVAARFVQAKGVVADALMLMMKSGCLATDNQSVNSLATSQYLNTVSAVGNGLFLQMMPPQQFVQALCSKVYMHHTACSSPHPLPYTPPPPLTPTPSPLPLPLSPTQPSILPAHVCHVREIIPQCDVSVLVQLAKLLDPSQSTIRPLLQKAMAHPRPRSVGV